MEQEPARIIIDETVGDARTLIAADPATHGNASHEYVIRRENVPPDNDPLIRTIRFQDGPVKENGHNGVQMEDLLIIVRDRLEGFQSGPFACDTNQTALAHVRMALSDLNSRTRDRIERGVEGKSEA